jgi:hypothetical protein
LTPTQVALAKIALEKSEFAWRDLLDLDAFSIGCDAQLANTNMFISGDTFSKSLDSVISAAKKKLAPE